MSLMIHDVDAIDQTPDKIGNKCQMRFTVEFLDEEGNLAHKTGTAVRLDNLHDWRKIMKVYFEAFEALVAHEMQKEIRYLENKSGIVGL